MVVVGTPEENAEAGMEMVVVASTEEGRVVVMGSEDVSEGVTGQDGQEEGEVDPGNTRDGNTVHHHHSRDSRTIASWDRL